MVTAASKGKKAVNELAKRLTRLVIEYAALDSIKPNLYNPNRQGEHDFELLKASMRTDGFTVPVLVNRETHEIVDGEHRWRAAHVLRDEGLSGFDEIPIVLVDMDEAQMKISTLRHNRARGSEDIELAANMLRDLEALGQLDWAQQELMLDDVELQRMLEDIAAPDALAADDFSTAWVPEGTHHASEEGQGGERSIGGATALEGITASASDRQREYEKALAVAKTDEERQAAVKDRDIYRIALTFDGAQAKTVRTALGDRPADELLRLCEEKLRAMQ